MARDLPEKGRFIQRKICKQARQASTLSEVRNWPAAARGADKHDHLFTLLDVTVETWLEYWAKNIVGVLTPNTRRNYRERYKRNIQPVIGDMRLTAVKPMHCKMVLNRTEDCRFYDSANMCAMGTVNRYIRMTDDSLSKAVLQFEQNEKIQNGTVMVQQRPLQTAETIENKGDIGKYETRYRKILTEFHMSM